MDGQGVWGAFVRIILPIALPGMVAAFVLSLVLTWNEYFFASLLTSTDAKTLPVMVASQTGSQGVNWWSMAAISFAAILPLIVVGVLLERFIIKGMSAGRREVARPVGRRSLHVRVAGAHRVRRLAEHVAQPQDEDLEDEEHRALEERAHRQDRAPPRSLAIVCAGMTRRSSASAAVSPAGSAVTTMHPGARFLRDLAQGRRGRERPGPRRTEEQVAGSERERGHVALHADLATEVVEPHRERPHHQALAPAAIEHHAARAGDRAHGRLERVPAGSSIRPATSASSAAASRMLTR